jgi:hypothetical protein
MVMCRKTLSGAEIADFGVAFASQMAASLLMGCIRWGFASQARACDAGQTETPN